MNLKQELEKVRNNAYSPYYNITVGAILITKSGKKYTGCNIETITQGPGICAERVAFSKAISEKELDFDRIYIMGGPKDKDAINITPCGVCRQFLVEFCEPDFKIINYYDNTEKEYLLKDLLPESFSK